MAILSVPERKMLLCDIYQYIMDTFEYYNNEEKPWRNSIRHNLSLNECFIKAGRSDNGTRNSLLFIWCSFFITNVELLAVLINSFK
ncbi:hypothetical protein DPMN_103433 [Dreissena polymorpha]|uniref:Fork-head domain-containing protein n=1 Tax=Dreissena polymorpha TaxID=45954 RepID=A0A9D4K0T2_DREPO|nr:hypothetical protein DPMN_103433 [Dreissena polymorpha]